MLFSCALHIIIQTLVSDVPSGLFHPPRGEAKLLEMLVLDGPRDLSHLEQCFLPCDLYSHSSISVQDLIQRSGYCQCCTFSCEVPRYSQTIPVLLKQ